MKISLNWLKDYVNLDGVSTEELKNGLFSCGFEVEEVIEIGNVQKVVTCKILSIEKHPDADKLSVCSIDAGEYGILQIVTNGTNIKVGDIVPVSLDGAVLADGMKIKKGKIRGVSSDGMFCGGEELGINGDQYEGADENCILVLKEEYPLGKDVTEVLGVKDTIFDISLTANRPDCMSVIGIAKEVACLLNRPFVMSKLYENLKNGEEISVEVQAKDLCPLYIASKVTDIKIAQSPDWMRKRLASVGIRSINNVVDITNYVLTEIGQPMHAFDYDNLDGKQIVVRRAENGEKIVTLDKKEFSLTDDDLVICDKTKPSCLAGVMGGLNSGINENTNTLVFESAKFKRDSIRKTSRKLGQRSDSSARFEKGVDSYTTKVGMARALYLMDLLKCGKVSGIINVQSTEEQSLKTISTTFSKINAILGIEVPVEKSVQILNNLNFNCVVDGDNLTVTVPPYREDVESFPDLAEEIIRFYGYDHIVPTLMSKASVTVGGLNSRQKKLNDVKQMLFDDGFCETVTYSFIGKKEFDLYSLDSENAIKIINPLGEDLSLMRTSLIPSLVNVACSNINKMNYDGKLYEIASVYIPSDKELPNEKTTLTMAVFGEKESFFTLKNEVEKVFSRFNISTERKYVPSTKAYLHKTRNADIFIGNSLVGVIGQLSPDVAESLDLNKNVFVAEIDLESLFAFNGKPIKFRAFGKYPKSERDLALVMNKEMTNQQVIDAIRQSGVKDLKEIELFDVYEGDKIDADKKSLAYHLTFLSNDKTLSYEEVEENVARILKNLEKKGITLRS